VAEAFDCKLLLVLHQVVLLAMKAEKGHMQEPEQVLQLALWLVLFHQVLVLPVVKAGKGRPLESAQVLQLSLGAAEARAVLGP
jgi:hypothetical protein